MTDEPIASENYSLHTSVTLKKNPQTQTSRRSPTSAAMYCVPHTYPDVLPQARVRYFGL